MFKTKLCQSPGFRVDSWKKAEHFGDKYLLAAALPWGKLKTRNQGKKRTQLISGFCEDSSEYKLKTINDHDEKTNNCIGIGLTGTLGCRFYSHPSTQPQSICTLLRKHLCNTECHLSYWQPGATKASFCPDEWTGQVFQLQDRKGQGHFGFLVNASQLQKNPAGIHGSWDPRFDLV